MPNPSPRHHQRIGIVASVLLLHLLALWALQAGLLQRAAAVVQDIVVPVAFITPPSPPPVKPPPPELPKPAIATRKPAAVATANPVPQAAPIQAPAQAQAPEAAPAPVTPAVANAAPAANAAVAPVGAAPGAAAPTPKIELPSSDAQYLQNPKPSYPRASRQRNEQGKVVVHVLIGTDGTALAAEVRVSSGYERLDQAALATVRSWRYVPGKRGGVPESMWFSVPINFLLE